MLIKKEISPSHARVLSKMNDEMQINTLAGRIVNEKLNVRDLENIVNNKDITKIRVTIIKTPNYIYPVLFKFKLKLK